MTAPMATRPLRLSAICAAVLLVLPLTAAHAVRGAGVPPPDADAVRAANPTPSAIDSSRLTLKEGRITDVNVVAGRIEIDGRKFVLVDGRSRIFRQGSVATPSALRRGLAVRYAPMPGQAERDTVAVIHVR